MEEEVQDGSFSTLLDGEELQGGSSFEELPAEPMGEDEQYVDHEPQAGGKKPVVVLAVFVVLVVFVVFVLTGELVLVGEVVGPSVAKDQVDEEVYIDQKMDAESEGKTPVIEPPVVGACQVG